MKADLHLHTTASDGRYSPEAVVRLAISVGFGIIAITDHDSIDGIEPALYEAKKHPDFTVIPGVEMSTDVPAGEVHILGYFIDYTNEGLKSRLKQLRDSRITRALSMIEKLKALGINVSWGRVKELAGEGSIGRPHIAQAMLERGYIRTFEEAFIKYIGRDGPAYAEREKFTPEEAVSFIKKMEGLAVLAHPDTIEDLDTMLNKLICAGTVGIEVYYDGYNATTTDKLLKLAYKHDLIPLGGSDYHGFGTESETPIGAVSVPVEHVQRLISLHNKLAISYHTQH